MNRRFFTNFIGSAIIGTAIALKIPDSLVPKHVEPDPIKLTFAALDEAYKKCCRGALEPDMLVLHPQAYAEFLENVPANKRWADKDGRIKIHNAVVIPNNWLKGERFEIQVHGGTNTWATFSEHQRFYYN